MSRHGAPAAVLGDSTPIEVTKVGRVNSASRMGQQSADQQWAA
jgi:hypothetical protein